MGTKAFTVSVPSKKYAKQADYVGGASGKTVNKFEKMGLTPVKAELVNAPYVGEFPLILECRVIHVFELGLHTQFVGQIMDVKADESVLSKTGSPDFKAIDPFLFSAADRTYYGVGEKIADAFENR